MKTHKLNNTELVNELKKVLGEERKLLAEFLAYLKDVLDRSIHLELGFKNAFEFCLSLGLSESCAYKRLVALDVIKRFPIALELIKTGEIHLSHLCLLSSVLTEDNHLELFSKIKGQSKRTAEILVQGLKEPVSIKPVSSLKIFSEPISVQAKIQEPNHTNESPSLFEEKVTASIPIPAINPTVAAELKLTCSPELLELLSRAKELTNTPNSELETLMIKVFKEFVGRHAPEEKEKRAAVRKEKPKKELAEKKHTEVRNPKSVRFIRESLKRSVYLKSNGQCSFVSQQGRRCSSTQHLQYDHIRPIGLGGTSSSENLQLLCRSHNQFKAKRDFGKEFIESFHHKKTLPRGRKQN